MLLALGGGGKQRWGGKGELILIQPPAGRKVKSEKGKSSATLSMLALVLLSTPALRAPNGVNARLRTARSSVRMITLADEVDEKAMLVRRPALATLPTHAQTHMN